MNIFHILMSSNMKVVKLAVYLFFSLTLCDFGSSFANLPSFLKSLQPNGVQYASPFLSQTQPSSTTVFNHILPKSESSSRPNTELSAKALKFWTPEPAKTDSFRTIPDLKGLSELKNAISNAGKPTVIRFHSKSCYSCSVVGSKCEKLAEALRDQVKFIDVDVSDPVNEKAQCIFNISAVPTIAIFDKHKKLQEQFICSPSDTSILRSKIEKYMTSLPRQTMLAIDTTLNNYSTTFMASLANMSNNINNYSNSAFSPGLA
mmetsp:Transcript_35162/g.61399  ORF Transcript_35162/g.61399 Transcript_35162/m.61399 type:complete len:260 (+) Transcript_35162:79-858(+)